MHPAATPAPDIAAAVQALTPQLTRLSFQALLGMAVTGVVALSGVAFAYSWTDAEQEDRVKLGLLALGLGIAVIFFLYRWMRRQQEALVMPVVAKAVGLTYTKDGKGYLRSLPERLLPRQSLKQAEDYVVGQLGSHEIRMAEVKVETGGKHSRTLFQGLVVEFRNQAPMPAFFLAPPDQTSPGVLFGSWILVDDLHHQRNVVTPSGPVLGLWTPHPASPEPPALLQAVEGVLALERTLTAPITLFSANSTGQEVYLALTHKRDLFQIGGLFPQAAQILTDVQVAATDLLIALSIAQEMIALEERVAAATV